ncbi:MAG: Phenylacetic acid catabolic protein, partial [Ferruginibacter sp.]
AIAEKSLKEITYHVKWSSEWVIRLGDGTEESHTRMEKAIKALWQYTGEFFIPANFEKEVFSIDYEILKKNWQTKIETVFAEATLSMPVNTFMHSGGKTGNHTEYLGYILAEMQHLQRTYPNAEW